MIRPRKPQRTRRRIGARLAATALAGFILAAGSARAALPPPPEVPRHGLYAAWLEERQYAREGWVRGMNPRHWLPPDLLPRSWDDYWHDEVRVLPETDLVLWLRRPAILDRLAPLAGGEDPYGNSVRAAWPGVQRRELLSWRDFLDRTLRERQRRQVLDKAAQTRTAVAQEDARGSLIDITIPLSLPESVERVVGRGEKSNITVTGRESITFSGETTRTNKFLADESGRGQPFFPRLEMKQDLQVKLSGTVGEKVHVEVENNSLVTGEGANKIRIRYEGDDDEIIKLIEMGDTQLSLPSSGLISYSTTNKGLFGIKMLGNLGPLDFTAIASKQEGEQSSRTFNNTGSVVQSDYVADTGFLANQFFLLDHPVQAAQPGARVVDPVTLHVFVDDLLPPSPQGEVQYAAFLYTDLDGDGLADEEPLDGGVSSLRMLDPEIDYKVWRDTAGNFRAIQLNSPLQESHVLAVSYEALDADSVRHAVGTVDLTGVPGWFSIEDIDALSPGDAEALQLELIKPENYTPDSPTWDYMMRNVYRLGGRNIDYSSLEVEVHRISTRPDPSRPENSSVPYLRAFGLDQSAADNNPDTFGHDGKVDAFWVDAESGLLFFPYFRPFDPPAEFVSDWTRASEADTANTFALEATDLNASLYDVPRRELLKNPAYSKFLIRFSSSTVASRFNLNAFDILEGSEVVILDGRQLSRGSDYRIDYFSGEVELIGNAAATLTPDSRVSITYQYMPLFGGGKSNLVGVHGTYNLGEKNKLSSAWLYESRFSGARRPRLGEESTRNVVGNVLGNFSAEPTFLTRAVNWLPRVDTDALSTVNLSGELAVSFPNPNIDGAAYLDDMEGAEDADELSLHRTQWFPASEPADVIRVPGGADIPVLPAARAAYSYWFHPQGTTRRGDFNLNLPQQEADEVVEILQFKVPVNLTPAQEDEYPPLAEVSAANAALGDSLWAGLMRGFAGEGLDLSEAEYLEIWINDFQQDADTRVGRLHFDMGDIDEDFFNPELDILDTEDRINRGVFDELEEDTGLDGVYSSGEGSPVGPYSSTGDPAGDDYDASRLSEVFGGAYFKVNGMEGNRRLDTEDLDRDGQLDTRNAYYTLDVGLDDEPLIDMVQVTLDETGDTPTNYKAWRLYRLKLADARAISDGVQQPDWTRIKYFRFWLEGLNRPGQDPDRPVNTLEIAKIKIVGNRWKTHGIQDAATGLTLGETELASGEVARVEVINTKDNANFVWPFGEEIDPETGLPEREQALNFVYENLQPGHQGVIRKDYQSLNLTGYRSVSFYVHADEATADHDIFFRAGFDSLNYYELVHRPANSGWTELNLELSDWTDLKLVADGDTVTAVASDNVEPSRQYTLRKVGNPDLSRTKVVYCGVVNDPDDEPLTGQTWFNDLRVKEVRRDTGYSGKVSLAANMANVIQLRADFRQQDPEFRGLRATQGTGATDRNWSVSGNTSLDHFAPLGGYKLPVSASYSRATSLPKYEPSSDVELTDAAQREEKKSETVSQRFSVQLSRSPSRRWLGRILLDPFKVGGALSQRRSSGPTRVELSEGVDYHLSWDRQFKDRHLSLFGKARLRWVPNSLTLKSDTQRSWTKSWSAVGQRFNPNPGARTGRMTNNAAVRWNFFSSFQTELGISDVRDLEHEQAERTKLAGVDVNLGFQTSQSQNLKLNYTLPISRRFKPRVTFQSHYSQSRQNFVAGQGQTASGTMNLRNDNQISTGYSFNIGSLFTKLNRGRKPEPARPAAPAVAQPRSMPRRLLVPVDPLRGPDPRQRRRVTRRFIEEARGPEPEAAVAAADTTGADPMAIVWRTLDVLGGLKPLKVDLSRRVNTSFNNVRGKPTLAYRLGFAEDPELPGLETGGNYVLRKGADQDDETRDLRLSTGITVAEKLQVTLAYDRARTEKRGRLSHTVSTNNKWPNVTVGLSGVETWPLWGDLMRTSSVGFGYVKTVTENENRGTGLATRTEALAVTPNWQITWRNDMRSNLTVSYNRSLNAQSAQTSKNTNLNVRLDWSYSLSAPQGLKIPGLRGLRFKSRLDLTGALAYTRTKNARVEPGGFEVPLGGASTLSVSPGARYQFTDKLSGSANLRYSRSSRDLTGEVVTTVGLSINATFIF